MDSSRNELERWTHGQGGRIGELVEPMTSPDNGNSLSPAKSIGSVDHPLHLPGRADSAYSSFSGGSNVPEYPTPPCCGETCCLPPEQAPYMDSEYVRGIYNLSTANPDPRCLPPCKAPELSPPSTAVSPSLAERCGSTPSPGAANQGPPPLVAPPPSPPRRLDSYKVTRHLENSRGRRSSGSVGESGVRPAPCAQDGQLPGRDAPWGQRRDEAAERDTAASRGKTLEKRGLSSGVTNEVPTSKIQGLKAEENGEWNPSQQPVKRSNPHVFSRPSSFIFQEYLKTDSVASIPKMLSAYNPVHAYRTADERNSKSSQAAHTEPTAVNAAREDKQRPCGVRQAASRAAELQNARPEPSQRRASLPCPWYPLRAESHSDGDQEVFEDSCDLKYMENALVIKNASGELNGCTDENQCCDAEGKVGSDGREPLPSDQAEEQRPLVSCSYGRVDAGHPRCEESEEGNPQRCRSTGQMSSFRPKKEFASQFLREVKTENQAHKSSPDPSTRLEQEEPPAQKPHPDFPKQPVRQPQDDLAAEQITRQTTPMLYYLSGGKTNSALCPSKLTQRQEEPRSSPKETPAGSRSASARCLEIQQDCSRWQRTGHPPQCPAAALLGMADLTLGSPASATEESLKNDYREKLKVAQKKVLRETSFKRKDLQMSLPTRLRQKPSKRPSIEHLRSLSLSSASEDAQPVPSSLSHLESLESFNGDEETKRPQTGRIGGRKRVAKEQKKLCYSEPEKLNQLAGKDVSWSQVRDEITEQDRVAGRRKALENRGRALSSSSISRTELKQIQHTALLEYMERKINQRPGTSHHLLPLRKPPLQKMPSHPKWPPGKGSNPNGSRKIQNHEVFSEEKPPDVFPPLAFVPPLSVSSGCHPSAAAGAAAPGHHPNGSCPGKCASAESLPWEGGPAAGRARERSKSTPPSTQEPRGCVAGTVAPAQRCGTWLGTPSFRDPEKNGCENHDCKASDITGCACCQDTKELAPETSLPVPRGGSEANAQVEEERGTGSPSGDAPVRREEQVTYSHTAHQGDTAAAQGLAVKEASVLSSQGGVGVLPGRDARLPRRRLRSPQDRRCEELAMELLARDSSLGGILMPQPLRTTALDLLEGLFPLDVSVLDKSHREKGDVQESESSRDATEECPESEHDAKQRSEDLSSKETQVLTRSRDSTDGLDDITSKKLELVASLRLKLQMLWEERELVLSEARECAERGKELEATVRGVCKANEFERYMMFIGDLEKVVSLLLCLSSRLARVQNAIRRIDGSTDAEERRSLNERHKLLSRQREDAKDLKENLDRRERVVSGILAKYLTEQQLQDYQRFVQVKTSLLIEQKDLEEQIKFSEEQLENLEQSIAPR